MRLRKVKHAKDLINDNPNIIIHNPEKLKGIWMNVFKNTNPIQIEVGCGKGKFIYELAKKHPNINFIGIEKFDSVIVRALEKIIENPVENLKLIRIDAENINSIFSAKEVDRIYLNFSDPWPKRRQAKRRLTSNKFLERYELILKPNSLIKFKSDNYGLFESSMMSFNNNDKFIIKDICLNLYKNLPEDNIQTEFEKRFVELGNPIYYIKVKYNEEV
ncbi:tRNA (guanosine(46)-N7)-methyltransferase TrmB [Mycoplasmatota bacterium WC30]